MVSTTTDGSKPVGSSIQQDGSGWLVEAHSGKRRSADGPRRGGDRRGQTGDQNDCSASVREAWMSNTLSSRVTLKTCITAGPTLQSLSRPFAPQAWR